VTSSGRGGDSERARLDAWLVASPAVALLAVLVYAGADHFGKGSNFGSVTAVGLAAGSAALASGALLGFLFGVPKALEQPKSTGLLATNTNLDQITEWLTKILVGLGLVQLGKVSHGVSRLASSLEPGLGGTPGAKAFATALLIYSAVDGFLIGYLWARIVLSERFRLAARALVQEVDQALESVPRPQLPTKPEVVAKTVGTPSPPEKTAGADQGQAGADQGQAGADQGQAGADQGQAGADQGQTPI
jgi:hypothetical protein